MGAGPRCVFDEMDIAPILLDSKAEELASTAGAFLMQLIPDGALLSTLTYLRKSLRAHSALGTHVFGTLARILALGLHMRLRHVPGIPCLVEESALASEECLSTTQCHSRAGVTL